MISSLQQVIQTCGAVEGTGAGAAGGESGRTGAGAGTGESGARAGAGK